MQTTLRHDKTRPDPGKPGTVTHAAAKAAIRGYSFEELSARSQTETTVLRKILAQPSSHPRR